MTISIDASITFTTRITLMKIFVAGLPSDMDESELEEFFEKYGKVDSVSIAKDRMTKKRKGFGFVEMSNSLHAKTAIQTLNGLGIGRNTLVVKEAV
jgi:RNA recognition motif-containing protein